jgi:hypothetical protein
MPGRIVIIVVSVLCGVGLIAAVGLIVFCNKRREKKKEIMANAFFEFSADKTGDHKPSKSSNLSKRKF